MSALQDALIKYNNFIDETNTANINSGLSFHCLTMGGLFGAAHRIYNTIHDTGPQALFSELFLIVFGSKKTDSSRTCMQRIIDADIKKILSTSAASAISSLSLFHLFSPRKLVRSLTYNFSAEFLKMLGLKNTLASYGRRLTPLEAFLTGSIAGLFTDCLFPRVKGRRLRAALRGGFREMAIEYIIRMVSYLMIMGISYVISKQIPVEDNPSLQIITK